MSYNTSFENGSNKVSGSVEQDFHNGDISSTKSEKSSSGVKKHKSSHHKSSHHSSSHHHKSSHKSSSHEKSHKSSSHDKSEKSHHKSSHSDKHHSSKEHRRSEDHAKPVINGAGHPGADIKPKIEPVTPSKIKPDPSREDDSFVESSKKVKKPKRSLSDDEWDSPKKKKKVKTEKPGSPKKKKKEEPEDTKWRWWEETRKDDGTKWKSLEHKGPVFAPLYEPVPSNVHFSYDGKRVKLSPDAEEVATFYARMLDHDYTTKDVFNRNFMKDWKSVMTSSEKSLITDLKKCNFHHFADYFKQLSEERKAMSKEGKKEIKLKNEAVVEEYGYCIMDGHKEKIGNFRIEPPGLFRGRGEHPKQGMLKRRTLPEDVIINCSRDAKVPTPPAGHRWKEVRHDNTVSWLACWNENIMGGTKYVMLNPASRLKGEKDWMKYEKARSLHKCVDQIREEYKQDLRSKEMRVRQRAVAMYFIDKLALRAGNEKDEDQADTVGCCSLRVEHIKLHEEKDGSEYVCEFDFLGKDSIRYVNAVPVEKRVYKNLQLFMENKKEGDDLFDRLNTAILNKHLNGLMDGLTAKVFRTYNASKTLQEQLDLLTNPEDSVPAKLLAYNRANRAVAILCNHQRAAPKNFDKQMENLQEKISAKKDAIKAAKKGYKDAKAELNATRTDKARKTAEQKKKAVDRLQEQLMKLEVSAVDKGENKEIALGTSKLNYLDPRVSVAWCKKWDVPIEKIYNKTQRDKFAWAIDMADEHYRFFDVE